MKALLLSGGTGTRLRPLTYSGAKQLIPVANKPILFYALEAIRDAGITDVGIVVGQTREEVKAAVGDGSRWGLSVTYIEQDAPRGLAHSVQIAEPFLKSDPFLMFLGDNLIRDGVAKFVQAYKDSPCNALVLLSEVSDPQRFGVAKLDGDRLVGLVEKPKNPPSRLALVGAYIFDKHIFPAVRQLKPSWRGELEITDAISQLIDEGKCVRHRIIDGWWKDTGRPDDVLEANRFILDGITTEVHGDIDADSTLTGRVRIESGATVRGSVVRGPVIIGEGAVIDHAYIGPYTAIGANVAVTNSEVENTVVMENSIIRDVSARIDRSLIGNNVSIAPPINKPRCIRFVLGDQSSVEVI